MTRSSILKRKTLVFPRNAILLASKDDVISGAISIEYGASSDWKADITVTIDCETTGESAFLIEHLPFRVSPMGQTIGDYMAHYGLLPVWAATVDKSFWWECEVTHMVWSALLATALELTNSNKNFPGRRPAIEAAAHCNALLRNSGACHPWVVGRKRLLPARENSQFLQGSAALQKGEVWWLEG